MKPRSNRRIEVEPPLSPGADSSKKSNPFGAAKPREQVLRQRGIDVKSLDAKFEAKAKITKFSTQQEEEIERVRQELTRLEAQWRQANEKELPEEVFRVQAEAKRQELKNLMAQFAAKQSSVGGSEASSEGGFTPVMNKATRKQLPYLPAKQGGSASAGGRAETFAAMSRHRFGTTAN